MSKLLSETLELLRTTEARKCDIAKNIGVSVDWLGKVRRGETSDPSVVKIERLYLYLKRFANSKKTINL